MIEASFFSSFFSDKKTLGCFIPIVLIEMFSLSCNGGIILDPKANCGRALEGKGPKDFRGLCYIITKKQICQSQQERYHSIDNSICLLFAHFFIS
jgi:hypothetical protein